MRVLGIDYGSKRIGLALGDTDSRIATAWSVIPNEGSLAILARLHEIVERDRVEAVVIGVPKALRNPNEENDQLQDVRAFIASLGSLGVTIHEENEAMSSGLAARQVQEAGEKGKRDDLAAANILQSWLDRHAVSS